jgi:putative membrane protein
MAFILGIYEELIGSIRSFDLGFVKSLFCLRFREALDRVSWPFLAAVGAGILTAIFTLARLLSWLLQNKPVMIWSFFFGLILGSILVVYLYFRNPRPAHLFGIAAGSIFTYLLVGLVPTRTPEEPWFLFLSGAVAICAMILPGISGAFILVVLGKYRYVLEAVNNRDFLVLAVLAAGAVVGLLSFVRLLGWFFSRHHDATIAVMTGLMLGSLRKVWPWKETLKSVTDSRGHEIVLAEANVLPPCWSAEVAWAFLLAAAGFAVVILLNRLAEGRKDSHRPS